MIEDAGPRGKPGTVSRFRSRPRLAGQESTNPVAGSEGNVDEENQDP
jgi:hypothetical protein